MVALTRNSIHRLPYDIAIKIADEIFSWVTESETSEGMQVSEEARMRDSTFKSLSSLNRSSRNIWLEFFVRKPFHRNSRSPIGPQSFAAYPHLGKHVEHLTFRDDPLGHSSIFDEEKLGEAEVEDNIGLQLSLCASAYYIEDDDILPDSFKTALERTNSHCRIAAYEIARGLVGFWKSEDLEHQMAQMVAGGLHLSHQLCSVGRSIILEQCPNLKSLSLNGAQPVFLFAERLKNKDSRLSKGLGSTSLKTLRMGKYDSNNLSFKATLSSQNIVFLLIHLPHVTQADLYGYLDEKGIEFLHEHSGILEPRYKSKIKDLTLRLAMDIVHRKGDLRPIVAYQNLLSFTHQLERLSLKFLPNESHGSKDLSILDQSILKGLESSSLKCLAFNAVNFEQENLDLGSLESLEMLEEFTFDEMFIMRYKNEIDEAEEYFPTYLPPNLKVIYLNQNLVRHKADGETHFFLAEKLLSDLILELSDDGNDSVPLKTIKASRLPKDEKGVVQLWALEEPRWIEARQSLTEACEEKGLELVLV